MVATVLRLLLDTSASSIGSALGLRPRSAIFEAGSGVFRGVGPAREVCLACRSRVASAFRSSGVQLSVCRSAGMSNFDSSCAAIVQGTSGGGGDGGLLRDLLLLVDSPDRLRLILIGSTTFAVEACVGEWKVEAAG